MAITVLHLTLLSMNSLNQTQTVVFTPLLHILFPGEHITPNIKTLKIFFMQHFFYV